MTKKIKQNKSKRPQGGARVRQLEKQLAAVKIQAKTPFSNAGALVGAQAGRMFNLPMLKGVGKWLGSGIGSIFGSGDYTIAGASPDYNVLTNGNQIPKFSSTHSTNIVCHREYLGDIMGTSAFTNNSYPLNPGMPTTFPWLSTIADNYQEYKFHGVIFEFRPLITDYVTSGSPGVVVMATNYNADLPVYTTKQQMENSEFAVSVKPTNALMHGVECASSETDPSIRYVRNAGLATGQDLKNYDYGTFQFATQSNPVQNLGELWVSYCVEFYKPTLTTVSGVTTTGNTLHNSRTTVANATAPIGSVQSATSGSLAGTVTSTTVTIPNLLAGQYVMINVCWKGATAVAIAYPIVTLTNATTKAFYQNGANDQELSPVSGTTAYANLQEVVQATAAGSVVFTFGLAGTLPSSATTVDIWVSLIDSTVTA